MQASVNIVPIPPFLFASKLTTDAPDWLFSIRQYVRTQGQLSKLEAGYVPLGLPLFQCSNCVAFEAATGTCKWVAGAIEPQAACSMWTGKFA